MKENLAELGRNLKAIWYDFYKALEKWVAEWEAAEPDEDPISWTFTYRGVKKKMWDELHKK